MAQENDLPLEEYHRAGQEITNGSPEGYKPLYSHRDDVTLANPFGPPGVEIESYRARVGGAEDITPVSVRVTTVFRREDGAWKVVHRHADPITAPRSPQSVVQT